MQGSYVQDPLTKWHGVVLFNEIACVMPTMNWEISTNWTRKREKNVHIYVFFSSQWITNFLKTFPIEFQFAKFFPFYFLHSSPVLWLCDHFECHDDGDGGGNDGVVISRSFKLQIFCWVQATFNSSLVRNKYPRKPRNEKTFILLNVKMNLN